MPRHTVEAVEKASGGFRHVTFRDFLFNVGNDAFFDVNKARRFGLHRMNLDTGEALVKPMNRLQRLRFLPA
jgi:hypothetical protein